MKKLAVLLMTIACAVALCACGGNTDEAPADTTTPDATTEQPADDTTAPADDAATPEDDATAPADDAATPEAE